MEHKKFHDIPHVKPALATTFRSDDIVWVEEKIDGANIAIRYDSETDTIVGQSRKLFVDEINTLRGFYGYVQSLNNNLDFKKKFKEICSDNIILFGEFLVSHTVKYPEDAYNKAYFYDAYDIAAGGYMYQAAAYEIFRTLGLITAPVFYQGKFQSWDFIQSFVGKTELGGEWGEGCFKSDTNILMADGTQKHIKDVQIGDFVKTYNIQTKKIEDKVVTNVFYNGLKPVSEWKNIAVFPKGVSSRGLISGKMIVTKNHKFFDGKSWTPIEDLDYVYHYGLTFDDFRQQAFLGLLVSDIHLSKGIFYLSQSMATKDDFCNLFEPFISSVKTHVSGKGSNIAIANFQLQSTVDILNNYTQNDKILYTKVFKDLNEIGWAFFLMGDGYADEHGTIGLCVASYSEEECIDIKKYFEQTFNVKTCFKKDDRVNNGSGLTIRTSAPDGRGVLAKISKYIMPNYRYKLKGINNAEDFIGIPKLEYNITKRFLYSNKNYTDMAVAKNRKNIGAWDIEVADNHNYFANGCLVHNCVVKNQTLLNEPHTEFYIKVVCGQFKETSHHKVKTVDPEKMAAAEKELELAKTIVTFPRVDKILHKLVDEGVLLPDWGSESMGVVAKNLTKRVVEDCIKEEKETVDQIPNFGKVANKISMAFAKDVLWAKEQ